MKLFMFAASLSKESCNKKLIQLAANLAKENGATVDLADFSEFSAPLYNADIQNGVGFPAEIMLFVKHLKEADGLVFATPEYNMSIPGTLKNIIDWVSRLNPVPFKGYPILLLSASPSLVGGNRGLWHTRVPLEACGAYVSPDMFSLASAYTAFNDKGQLLDSKLMDRLKGSLKEFMRFAEATNKLTA